MIIRIINKLRRIQNILYSAVLKTSFGKTGKKFYIEYPARILGAKYITIGENFSCFGRVRLEAHDFHNGDKFSPEIFIGNNVSINFDCHIGAINKIVIGNNVLFASKIFITDHYHGNTDVESLTIAPSYRPLKSKGEVIIEDNVWVGEGVAIMPNVRIGKNSIVGANSVVTKSFPENSVIGGIPAKLIKLI